MGKLFASFAMAAAFGIAFGQQGGNQGPFMGDGDGSSQSIDRGISTYLNGPEAKAIVSPGENCEWTLNLKAGQVVFAEARSDAFDPAIQIVDGNGKALAKNDDRYPGDQRPLLMWRCEQEGAYKLEIRSFHDKSGGQVFVRYSTYDSVDLSSGEKMEKDIDARSPFLLRVPMKAGQLKEVVADMGGEKKFLSFRHTQVIGPYGLPDINLSRPIGSVVYALMAPVDGDYYILETPYGAGRDARGRVRVGTREVVPGNPAANAKTPNNTPALFELNVKAGQFLEISTPELAPNCKFVMAEKPDISKFDVSKPETNPFFPKTDRGDNKEAAFELFPARARDNRITVFYAHRDATLWLASNGAGPQNQQFTMRVKPAASAFLDDKPNEGKLKIGNTDYWAFDAKAGDVMTLNSTAAGFAQQILVRDPTLEEIRQTTANLDQTSDNWRMIVQKPGRYLVAVSCLGNGGGGEYSISRKVFHAKDFSKATPAKSEIGEGQIQIWKFTATPADPLFIRWNSSKWSYGVSIYDEKGNPTDFQRENIDGNTTFGILHVREPRTYVIVLTGGKEKASYAIELNDLPGYRSTLAKSGKG